VIYSIVNLKIAIISKAIKNIDSGGCAVVEHLPCYPMVKGSSPGTAACTGREIRAGNVIKKDKRFKNIFLLGKGALFYACGLWFTIVNLRL